jgi:hypothetical protein
VNSVSRSFGSALPASISHIRARRRASATNSSGTSGIAEIAITVAQRRTVRTPSRLSASRTELTVRGKREEGGVDVAQQLQRQADVGGDDPLEVLEGHVAGGQLRQLAQRPEAGGGDPAVADSRGLAK